MKVENYPGLLLSLVVPTYNERESLPVLVERVHKCLNSYSYEIVVVDDNSPDGTAEVAESLSSQYPLRVICRKTERGLASAVVAGFRQARGEVLGVIDADLQHPPEMIPELLSEIQKGADIAVASRYIPSGGVEGWSMKRKVISQGSAAVARLLLPSARRVKDPLSGFFLLRRRAIEGVELKPIGYKILLEVLVRGKADEVKEVPYVFRERAWGKSKLNVREEVNYLRHLFSLATSEVGMKRFLKFCLVGLSGVGVNVGLLWLLNEVAGLSLSYLYHLQY
jgi:dolichol-phosphate mannosyltransferase